MARHGTRLISFNDDSKLYDLLNAFKIFHDSIYHWTDNNILKYGEWTGDLKIWQSFARFRSQMEWWWQLKETKYDTDFGFSQISLSASLAFFAYDKFPVAVFINFCLLPLKPSVNRGSLGWQKRKLYLLRTNFTGWIKGERFETLFYNFKFCMGINSTRSWLFFITGFWSLKINIFHHSLRQEWSIEYAIVAEKEVWIQRASASHETLNFPSTFCVRHDVTNNMIICIWKAGWDS